MNHAGKRLFISGIPTSGKSYLAKRLADEVHGVAIRRIVAGFYGED